MKKTIAAATLAVLSTSPLMANDVHDALMTYSDAEKKATFKKYLNLSGEKCSKVNRVFHNAYNKRMDKSWWSIDCGGGNSYLYQINSDSTTSIMDCSLANSLNIECFNKWKD